MEGVQTGYFGQNSATSDRVIQVYSDLFNLVVYIRFPVFIFPCDPKEVCCGVTEVVKCGQFQFTIECF